MTLLTMGWIGLAGLIGLSGLLCFCGVLWTVRGFEMTTLNEEDD